MSLSNLYTVKANFKIGTGLAYSNATDVDIVADTVHIPNHGLKAGQSLGVKVTSGTITTGLTATTAYYVISVDGSTIAFATSRANAFAGTKVNLTAIPTGVITLYPNGNGITLSEVIIPNGHAVVNAYYHVTTTAIATASSGTLAISVEGANDIVSAAAISTNVWDDTDAVVLGIPDFATVGDFKITTADRPVTFTVGTSPWNTGELDLFLTVLALQQD